MNWNVIGLMIIILSVFFSGTFASAETALFSLPWFRVLSLGRKSKRGLLIEKLRSNPQKLLLDIIVGNFLLLVFVSVTLSSIIHSIFSEEYLIIAMFGFSVVLVIIGELIPKGLAMRMPEEASLFLAPIINGFSKFANPFRLFLIKILGALIPKGLFVEEVEEELDLGKISDMVDVGLKQGFFDKVEGYLIGGLLRLKQTKVEDIMRRRGDVVLLAVSDTIERAKDIIEKSRYSRIPVYENDVVNIVGYVHFADIVSHIKDKDKRIDQIMHKLIYLPENTNVFYLLEKMRIEKCHIGVVVNEYGETVGIITLEDIMNEFLKDIVEIQMREHIDFTMLGLGQFLVSGSFHLNELEEVIGIKIERDYSKTLGGYIMEVTGRVPEIGERIEIYGYEAVIMDADKMRIKHVFLRKI